MPTEAEYEAMLDRADDLFEVGKSEEANGICRHALREAEAAGDEAFVHCFQGELAFLEGDDQRSLEEKGRAFRLSPDSSLLNREMACALNRMGLNEEALGYYDRALLLRPDYARALCGRASTLTNLSRHHETLDAVNKALEITPGDPYASAIRAAVLLKMSMYEDALSTLDGILAIEPTMVFALVVKGAVLAQTGRPQDALECFAKADALRPRDTRNLVAWAVVLANRGRLDEALAKLDEALEIGPRKREARLNHAIVLGRLGRRYEAVGELQGLLDDHPDDEKAKLWLFRFSGLERAPEQARELEEQRAEERRRQEQKEYETRIRLDAWRRLSGRTAHRVGNQLFAARGALRTLREQAAPDRAEEIQDIEDCLNRIGRVCTEFRRFSAERPPKPKATDVRLLVQDAVRRYGKSAEGIELTEDLPPLLPECRWDAQQVEQAVTELLENAIRHTPKGKRIRVSAEALERDGKQHVRIVIQNEGEGIDAKYKARLFEPFFSLRPGGTGLGLAIVRQVIENHKGSVRETGEAGKFARFEIELPARPFEDDSHEGPGD
ncbi:MAG: tetratricopeptide repeat protein [Planctomycetota bacterium]|jgi:signal transduction histidine kinase